MAPIAAIARGAARGAASSSTPTPRRPPGGCRSTCARSASTCCRCRPQARRPAGRRRALGPPRRRAAPARHRRPAGARAARRDRERRRASSASARPRARRAAELPQAAARMAALRDRLWQGIVARGARRRAARPGGGPSPAEHAQRRASRDAPARACSCCSTWRASRSRSARPARPGAPEPSHVLRAIGLDDEAARGGLRLSLGPDTTAARDRRACVDLLPRAGRARSARRRGRSAA